MVPYIIFYGFDPEHLYTIHKQNDKIKKQDAKISELANDLRQR